MSDSANVMRNSVHQCDCLELIQRMPGESCDLVYVDPPFASGSIRRKTAGSNQYDDRWSGGPAAFAQHLRPRFAAMREVMAPHATLYVHVDWRSVHHIRFALDEVFGESNFMNEVIWQYRTGGNSARWFGRKHDNILVYAKRLGEHRFQVQRSGQHRTEGMKYDECGRPYKSTLKGRLYFHEDGPAMSDVWDIPFLSTVSSERVDWPTQKPLRLIQPIIEASSRPGDLVADFFCGSGTTLVAASQFGRDYIGCDISSEAVRIATQRLAECSPLNSNSMAPSASVDSKALKPAQSHREPPQPE